MSITVNVIGAEGLKKSLKEYAARVESESAKANATTAVMILSDVRNTLQYATAPGQFGADTGNLAGYYHVEVVKGGGGKVYPPRGAPKPKGDGQGDLWLSAEHTDPKSALVGAVSDHVLPVEFGRAPGSKQPPPGALRDWLRRHGLPESMEYPVARAIARRGIQAQPHLHPAVERARSAHLRNLKGGLTLAADKAAGKNVAFTPYSEGS